MDPQNEFAFLFLGDVLWDNNKFKDSKAAYNKYVKIRVEKYGPHEAIPARVKERTGAREIPSNVKFSK